MTTGRINQVTTNGGRGAPRRSRPDRGTPRTLADGRPDSHGNGNDICLANPPTQTPDAADRRGPVLHAADARRGRRRRVNETTEEKNAFPCGQRCNLADDTQRARARGGQAHPRVRTPGPDGDATEAQRPDGDGTCGADSRGAQRHPDSTNGTQLSAPELALSKLCCDASPSQ